MLEDTAFSLANASPSQIIAFFAGAIAHTCFFIWIIYLVRMR
jgi:hypothetical protein